MEGLSGAASSVSVVAITIALIICLAQLSMQSEAQDTHTASMWEHTTSFFDKVSALSAMVFASGVQKLFVNIQAEMREPEHFPRALLAALAAFM